MKGILATVCAFALLGSVMPATFPNDLFYHHHPNLAVADSGGGRRGHTNNKYAHAHGGHRSSGRHNYHGPPSHHRNANLDISDSTVVGNPYLPHKRSYNRQNYEDQGRVVYTKDGGIDWSKTKVTKFSAASDEDQQQQGGQGYGMSHNNQRNPFNNEDDYEYQQQSPRRYNNEGNYRGNYYGDNQHNGNRHYRNYNSGGSYGNNHYRSNSRYSNNDHGYNDDDDYYYENENYEDNYGYDDNNDIYSGQYDDNNDNYGGQNDDNDNNNNNDASQKTKNAYTASHDDSGTSFAGGIRLAGALPDDGYHHGEGTFYDLENRISTCGKQSKNTEFVAALNSEQMGDSSSKNENCGKEAEIIGPSGKSVKVTIVDSCKTCKNGGLDLSPAAFEEIGEFSQGTIPIKWKFV